MSKEDKNMEKNGEKKSLLENSEDKNIKDEIEGVQKLKEIGLREVSNKTFINLDNLKALLDRDFKTINKTKAFGFIHILERDFDVDLSKLKEEYIAHSTKSKKKTLSVKKEHQKEQKIKPTKKKTAKIDQESIKRYQQESQLKKYLPLIIFPLLALIGFYFINQKGSNNLDRNVLDLNVVKNEDITKEVKENLLALEEEENETKDDLDDVDLNRVVKEMFGEELNETDKTAQTAALSTEQNDSARATNPTSFNTTTSDKNDTQNTLQKTTLASLEKTSKLIERNSTAQTSQKSVDVEKEEPKATASPSTAQTAKQTQKETVEKKTTKKATTTRGLYIKPIKKAWVGVIYLDTFQKKDYLVKNYLKLNPNRDQIILVGHRHFKIFNKGKETGFKSKRTVRFLYENGRLREIDKNEYLLRSGGVTW
jgi:hypothetical protein